MRLKIQNTLGEAWNVYMANFTKLSVLGVFTALPLMLVNLLFLPEEAFSYSVETTNLVARLANFFLTMCGLGFNAGAMSCFISKVKAGESQQMSQCLRQVVSRTGAIIGIAVIMIGCYFLLLGVVVGVAFLLPENLRWLVLLLLIGGVIALAWFLSAISVSEAAVVIEDLGPVQGIKRSMKLTKGNVRTILLILVILGAPAGIVVGVINSSLQGPAGLLALLVTFFFMWTFIGVLRSVIYLKLKEVSAIGNVFDD